MRDKFAGLDTNKLSRKERKEFAEYTELRATIESKRANFEQRMMQYGGMLQSLERLQQEIGEDPSAEEVASFQTTDPQLGMMKNILGNAMGEGRDGGRDPRGAQRSVRVLPRQLRVQLEPRLRRARYRRG